MTDDPVARLKAGLDADEAAAKEATPGPWMTGAERAHLADNVVYGRSDWPDHIQQVCNVDYAQHKTGNADHIARQDPARTLRRVAAMQEILDKYEAAEDVQCTDWDSGYTAGQAAALKTVIATLAAVYGDDDA